MADENNPVIPPNTKFVVVIEPTAHMDWDWVNCFPYNVDGKSACGETSACSRSYKEPCKTGYFNHNGNVKPSNTIYAAVVDYLQSDDRHSWSACEIAFLRKYQETAPASDFAYLRASSRFKIIGGGITSPDNLLSNGECFIRCFLVGVNWCLRYGLAWSKHVWIPDDFGHDSQLPALLVAIGATAVGFARVPGGAVYNGCLAAPSDQPKPVAGVVLPLSPQAGGGLDFYWMASDGRKIFAHWMPNGYSQAYNINVAGGGLPNGSIAKYVEGYTESQRDWCINQEVDVTFVGNRVGSPTPNVHIPSAWDFGMPISTLQASCDEYNASPDNQGGFAVIETFDYYTQRVLDAVRDGQGTLLTRSYSGKNADARFRSNPYFMGFYASRMALKQLHNRATRTLLAAELFDTILTPRGRGDTEWSARLAALWDDLVPSTHHDYITGTANDCVYCHEQLPLLQKCVTNADILFQDIKGRLGYELAGSASNLVILNTLSSTISNNVSEETVGVVEVNKNDASQIHVPPLPYSQRLADGRMLVWGRAPSLGFRVYNSNDIQPPPNPVQCQILQNAERCVLSNGLLSLTIDRSAGWTITHMYDGEGNPLLPAGTANYLRVFQDGGSIYSFGYECLNPSFNERKTTWTGAGIEVTEGTTESMNLRCTVEATVNAAIEGLPDQSFVMTYSLSAGEPFVRISLRGTCPVNSSVFVYFPLLGQTHTMEHGTPYHWDEKQQETFGTSPVFNAVFQPTHAFVRVQEQGKNVLTVYHADVPAWGLAVDKLAADSDRKVLVGCLLRSNDPDSEGCDGRGAAGEDRGLHEISYALRIPSPFGAMTGKPIQEARRYASPLIGALALSDGTLHGPYSLASMGKDFGHGSITAVKRGTANASEIYLRVYNPANDFGHLQVAAPFIGDPPAYNVEGATAIEQDLSKPEQDELKLAISPGPAVNFYARSITTLRFRPK